MIIIGGGVGGLCLAQGLRKAGIGVAVYEKGPKRVDPHWLQGYQIHVNPSRSAALKECLPPTVWETLLANACVANTGFQVLTEQMKEIAFVEPEVMDGTSHVPIVRATLREVLLEGLDDTINVALEDQNELPSRSKKVRICCGIKGSGAPTRRPPLPHRRIALLVSGPCEEFESPFTVSLGD